MCTDMYTCVQIRTYECLFICMPLGFIRSSVVTVESDSLFNFARVAARPAPLWCDIHLSEPIRGQLRYHVCSRHYIKTKASMFASLFVPKNVYVSDPRSHKFYKWRKKNQTSVTMHHSRPDFVHMCLFPNFPRFLYFWCSHHRASHGRPPAEPSPTSRWQPGTSQHPETCLKTKEKKNQKTNQHAQLWRGGVHG